MSSQSNFRRVRGERLLLEELRTLLRDAVDPELEGVRPLTLELSPDGGHARVPYVVDAPQLTDESAMRRTSSRALERASGFLRARLASNLELRKVPTLGFQFVGLAAEDAAQEGGEPCLE
ncbi:MAG: ribosome-binding factor A [Deltaproteobacteria bacterium]|nr:ribosome-binding factor A [Deltaproteobacteria bacterium]